MDLLSIFTYNVTLVESLRFCGIEYGFRLIFLFILFWFRLLNCRLCKGVIRVLALAFQTCKSLRVRSLLDMLKM